MTTNKWILSVLVAFFTTGGLSAHAATPERDSALRYAPMTFLSGGAGAVAGLTLFGYPSEGPDSPLRPTLFVLHEGRDAIFTITDIADEGYAVKYTAEEWLAPTDDQIQSPPRSLEIEDFAVGGDIRSENGFKWAGKLVYPGGQQRKLGGNPSAVVITD